MKRQIKSLIQTLRRQKNSPVSAAISDLKEAMAHRPNCHFGKMIYHSLHGKTIDEFAAEVGVSASTVGAWIKGKQINLALQHKEALAQACHTNVAYVETVIRLDIRRLKETADFFNEIAEDTKKKQELA